MAKVTSILKGEINFFPYQCETPVVETLEWLTDLTKAWDGTEERYENRSFPRRSFDYKFPLSKSKTTEAFNSLYGALREDWSFPVWTEAQFVGNISGGSTSIVCDTTNYEFKDSSLGLLFSSNGYEVIDIDEVLTNAITILGSGLTARVNTYLMPVLSGFISGNVDKFTNGFESKVELKFTSQDDNSGYINTPSQYKDEDIYYNSSVKSKDKDNRVLSMKQNLIDFKLGFVEDRTPWVNINYNSPFKVVLETPEEILEYKQFLYRRAGKYRGFWFPTSESDFRLLSTGFITDTLIVSSDSIIDYTTDRINILIKRITGSGYLREITNFVQIDSERVALTISVDLNMDAIDVAHISFLGYCRSDTDRVKLNWIGGGTVKSQIKILELSS